VQDILLSPIPFDCGKCNGGVTHFLKESLLNQSLAATAKEFTDRVPLDGVIHQELYIKMFDLTIPLDFSLVEMWDKKCIKANISLETKPPEIVDSNNPRAACILSSYLQYLFKHRTASSHPDPIKWVDTYIQKYYFAMEKKAQLSFRQ
jgi:hypothetical protein